MFILRMEISKKIWIDYLDNNYGKLYNHNY